jgi:hypothetical protein
VLGVEANDELVALLEVMVIFVEELIPTAGVVLLEVASEDTP